MQEVDTILCPANCFAARVQFLSDEMSLECGNIIDYGKVLNLHQMRFQAHLHSANPQQLITVRFGAMVSPFDKIKEVSHCCH